MKVSAHRAFGLCAARSAALPAAVIFATEGCVRALPRRCCTLAVRLPRVVIGGAAAAATAVAALASVLEEAAVAVVRVEGVRRLLFVR